MARPAEFDRQDVLQKAMNVFWRTGYSATSVSDLVNATNLKPGSLYGAFQSKRGLFIEVIDTYAQRSLNRVESTLGNATDPLQGIEAFFKCFTDDLQEDNLGQGCLLVNTMLELATEDDEIRERISDYLNQVQAYFTTALTKAKDQGLIDSGKDAEALSTFLMTGIWGLRVLSSKRPDNKAYQDVVTQLMIPLHTSSH